MLRLLEYGSLVSRVGWESPEKLYPEVTDWNFRRKLFTPHREALIGTNGWSEARLTNFLKSYPDGCIYVKAAHNPILALGDGEEDLQDLVSWQRITLDGVPYIDMFGLHVYVRAYAAWYSRSDVDLRFNANQYPYHHLVPEIELSIVPLLTLP